MNDNYETLIDFVTLLQQERKNPTGELFGQNGEYLIPLRDRLATVGDDENELADIILDWAERYPEIQARLNGTDWIQVRCDMLEAGKEPPPKDPTADRDRVSNKMMVAEIDKTRESTQSQSS